MAPVPPQVTEAFAQLRAADLIDVIREAFNTIKALPIGEDAAAADLIGEVRALEVAMAEWRRGLQAETPTTTGEKYKVSTATRITRSYNTAAILYAVNPDNPTKAFWELRRRGALEIKWKYRELKAALADMRIMLRTVHEEITDDGDPEGPMIGETRSETRKIEGTQE